MCTVHSRMSFDAWPFAERAYVLRRSTAAFLLFFLWKTSSRNLFFMLLLLLLNIHTTNSYMNLLLISLMLPLQLLEPSCLVEIISTHTFESLSYEKRRQGYTSITLRNLSMHNDLWHIFKAVYCSCSASFSLFPENTKDEETTRRQK